MGFEELKEEMLRLAPEARALLARELLACLEGMSEAETEKFWVDEAIRRDEPFRQKRYWNAPGLVGNETSLFDSRDR